MKEVCRYRDFTIVAQYRDLLEREGIPTFIRNENLSSTEVSITEFFPNLCVLNDSDYEPALEILKTHREKAEVLAQVELDCLSCGEKNPGTFELCFSCEEPLPATAIPTK